MSPPEGIVQCANCGLVYDNLHVSNPTIIPQYENRKYDHLSQDWIDGRQAVFQCYRNLLTTFQKQNRILDVGAGHGFFLAMCQEMGWECHGIEPSNECRRFAADRFHIELGSHVLEDVKYKDGYFDVVTFFNVLDQLPDPTSALREASRILRPGGAVIIRCANARFHVPVKKTFLALSTISQKIRNFDQTVFHLYAFDKRTIARMLTEANFNNVTVFPGTLSWTASHDSPIGSLKKLLTPLIGVLTGSVYRLTLGNILLTPSLTVVATIPMPGKN